MSPEERQLIAGLFERMRGFGPPEKDREAETLINQSVRAMPDAAYMLVQSVLVQEQGLQASQSRIQELEDRLRELEGEQPAPKSGGFLGGYWGGRKDEPRAGSSVPQVGARATPSPYESRSPWSSRDAGAPPPPQQQQQPAPAASGGFMRSALTTAAGVAGGMLVADSLRNMLGGAHASPSAAAGTQGGSDHAQEAKYVDEDDNDPGTERDDDGNDPGFDSGGELDI